MKRALLLTAALLVSALPAASESPLDLGDIYVWGEDMSVFEGIRADDRLLYPSLEKSAFIEPYSGDIFKKLLPRAAVLPSDGIYLHAGVGSYDGYIMRLVHAAEMNPWSVNWRITGKQKNIDSKDEYNRRMTGVWHIGYRSDYFNGMLNLRGNFEDEMPEREFYHILFAGGIKAGKFSIRPSVYYAQGETSSVDAVQSGAGIGVERDIAYYQTLRLDAETRQSSIDGEKDNFFRTGLNLRSRMFRDFTFSLGGGIASGSEAEYGGYVSGEMLDTGYRFYYKNSFSGLCFYEITEKSEALVFRDIFSPEKVSEAGIELYRDTGVTGMGELKFSNKSIKDKIIYVKNDKGTYFPYNYEKSADIFTASAGLKKYPAYISFKYTALSPRLPFYAETELNIGVDYETPMSFALLGLSADLKYIGESRIWNTAGLGSTSKHGPSSSLNAGASLKFGSGIFLKAGVKNILGEKIVREGFFEERKTRFYLIGGINLPIRI